MDSADHWLRDFVCGCLRFGGVVHGLCPEARFRAVRRISNYRGHRGFVLGVATRAVRILSRRFSLKQSEKTRMGHSERNEEYLLNWAQNKRDSSLRSE